MDALNQWHCNHTATRVHPKRELLSAVVCVLIFACYLSEACAQASGAWTNPTTRADGTATPKDKSLQTYRPESANDPALNKNSARGLYRMPHGATELWPECEIAIAKVRDALSLAVTVPAVVVVADTGPRGYYIDGVITIRKDADCSVLVHELVHHRQFLRNGKASNAEEWHSREEEAKRVERLFRSAND